MGAGVLPFSIKQGEVLFLFHTTFSGRRAGSLIDFGGKGNDGESHRDTAIREFMEETEMMYLSDNFKCPVKDQQGILAQTRLLQDLFDRTLQDHPDWYCQRSATPGKATGSWTTFFIEFGYKEVNGMNREWKRDGGRRFVKRRKLIWITADELQNILVSSPERLWKRVQKLDGMENMIQKIVQHKQSESRSIHRPASGFSG